MQRYYTCSDNQEIALHNRYRKQQQLTCKGNLKKKKRHLLTLGCLIFATLNEALEYDKDII